MDQPYQIMDTSDQVSSASKSVELLLMPMGFHHYVSQSMDNQPIW